MRIISLLSSATEILHALGLGEFQVGRSHECDYPAAVAALPVCSRPNIPIEVPSRQIDELVRERAASAISIYDLDSDLIGRLKPTHILTQTQCKVCAVSLDDVESALARTTGVHAQVVSLEPHCLAHLWTDIGMVAQACQAVPKGESLVAQLQAHLHAISAEAAGITRRPSVVTIEWLDPVMTAGNWIPELIEIAGGKDLLGTRGGHSPYVQWEEVLRADPDVLILFPCGFDIRRSLAELPALTKREGWNSLRAVQEHRVFVCDGNQYMNRPGPRLVDSARIFAEILHPELFPNTLEGDGWIRLPK